MAANNAEPTPKENGGSNQPIVVSENFITSNVTFKIGTTPPWNLL